MFLSEVYLKRSVGIWNCATFKSPPHYNIPEPTVEWQLLNVLWCTCNCHFDERYQLDATILFIVLNNSTCFGHLYAHLQEYSLYVTAYGVQHCKRELCVSGWFCFMLFVMLCNCWLRLCCMLYWVPVLHNTCYAHWSGWKCRGGAGACSVWLFHPLQWP